MNVRFAHVPEIMEEVVSPSLARNRQQAAPVVHVLTVVGVTPPSEHSSLSDHSSCVYVLFFATTGWSSRMNSSHARSSHASRMIVGVLLALGRKR